jgi:hypothetical protein
VAAHGVAGVEQCRLTDSTHSVCPPFRRCGRRTSARPFYCNTGLLQARPGAELVGQLDSVPVMTHAVDAKEGAVIGLCTHRMSLSRSMARQRTLAVKNAAKWVHCSSVATGSVFGMRHCFSSNRPGRTPRHIWQWCQLGFNKSKGNFSNKRSLVCETHVIGKCNCDQ